MTGPDYSRLPKYGQEHIAELERRIEALGQMNARLLCLLDRDYPGSDTFADPYGEKPLPLGRSAMVRFNGSDTTDDTFDVSMRGGELQILVNGTREDTAIVPQSNNTVRIRRIPRKPR